MVKKMKHIIYLLSITFVFSSMSNLSHASDEKPTLHWLTEPTFYYWLLDLTRNKGVAPVKNALYNDECGACHFAFPPGLLPEESWRKLLNADQLEDHFDDSAELDEDVRIKLLDFTTKNSADKSWYKRSRKIMASLNNGEYPLRITEIPYIKQKHSEIPIHKIRDNDKVNSLSYCDNCHTKAAEGIFDDDTVFIPN